MGSPGRGAKGWVFPGSTLPVENGDNLWKRLYRRFCCAADPGAPSGGSMITNSRDEWERTFNICWGGVYNCTRAFLPMLQNAEEGHIVNTSSINGFWASVGPRIPHTAYSAA